MEENGYSNEDIMNLKNFTKVSRAERKLVSKDWEENKTVPSGWKLKISNGQCVLSPGGKEYKNRRLALQAMILQDYPNTDIEEMRKLLRYEGWNESPYLPDGWIMKDSHKSFFKR